MAFSQLVSDDRAGVRHDLTSLSSCRPLVSSFRLSITWASFCSSTSLFFSSSSFRADASVMILSLLAGTLLTSSSCTEHKRSVERLQSCSASGDQDASPSPCLSEAVSAVSWLCSWCVWASRAPPRPAGPAGWTSPSGSLWTWSAWSVSFWGKTSTTPFNYETAIKTWPGLAKSLARRPGAIVFSSRATKMYHCPARRATLNTGLWLPRNVPSKLRARVRTLLQPRHAEEIMCRSHAKISWENHLIECQ